MGVDLDFLIKDLPLDNTIKQAILQYKGDAGLILKTMIQFEHADWGNISPDIPAQQINRCYFEAIKWCDKMTASLH